MERASKEALTRGGAGPKGLPEDDVEVPGIGMVHVRALNRGEMIHLGKLSDDKGQAVAEQYMLSCAMLDPQMTQEDIADWQTSGPGMEMHPVVMKINALSKATQEDHKSDLPGDGEQPVA